MSEEHATPHKRRGIELSPSVSIIIAGIIIAAAIIFTNSHPGAPTADAAAAGTATGTATATTAVPAPSASDHLTGSLTAPIVLIEYSDFQCPYCQMIYPTLQRIVSESGGQVAWVMRNFPLYQIHPNALPAANAAECIAAQKGNTAWWQFADDDFNNQANIGTPFFTSEAQKLGVNMTEYNTCVSAATYQQKIETEIGEAENSGGQGTPYTVIYNTKTGKEYPISGALPYEQIMATISQAKAGQ